MPGINHNITNLSITSYIPFIFFTHNNNNDDNNKNKRMYSTWKKSWYYLVLAYVYTFYDMASPIFLISILFHPFIYLHISMGGSMKSQKACRLRGPLKLKTNHLFVRKHLNCIAQWIHKISMSHFKDPPF